LRSKGFKSESIELFAFVFGWSIAQSLKTSDFHHFWGQKADLPTFFCTEKSIFKLFFKGKKEFSSCSHIEICKFHVHEDKANAHAGMPFCGVSQFAV